MTKDELFRLNPKYKHPKPPPKTLKLSSEPKENAILASVLAALNFYPNVLFFHRMNSGAYTVGQGLDRRFIRFGFPGCPDILGMLRPRKEGEPGALLALEVKSHLGRVSDHQEHFLAMVLKNGGCAGVVRSVDDLKQIFDKFYA